MSIIFYYQNIYGMETYNLKKNKKIHFMHNAHKIAEKM